jgi:hypothetical protein
MDAEPVPSDPPRGRRWPVLETWDRLDGRARRDIILALTLLLCYGLFRQVPAWNEYSRYDLTRALVDDGTTRIDPYAANTGDKAVYDGHVYSDKAPGTSFIGVPVYALFKLSVASLGAPEPGQRAAVHALAFGVSGLSTVLLVLLLLRFLRPVVGEGWAVVVSLGYGLGSIAFPFATMLFGHAASAFFLFAAFYVLWRAEEAGRPAWLPTVGGLLAGWAVLVELSAMLGVVVLLGYALVHAPLPGRRVPTLRWPVLARVMLGGSIPAGLLLVYNWASFGSPLSLGYEYLAAGGFAEGMRRGILGVEWPDIEVLGDLLVGPRGLLRMAPWFMLAPVGLLALLRQGMRREVLVCAAIVAAFLVFNAGYYLPFGGWTPGPRFLTPALPFAALLVAIAPRPLRPLAAILIAVAVALMIVATVTMPNAPEAYEDPLLDFWMPRLLSGDLAETVAWTRWGLHGVVPLVILALALIVAAIGAATTLRMDGTARRVGVFYAAILAVFVVMFSVPFGPASGIDIALASIADEGGSIEIVDAESVPVAQEGHSASILWARLENRGPTLTGTRVVFTVHDANGQPSWSAWHSDVSWQFGDRRRLAVEWDTRAVQPGDYRFEVAVQSGDPPTSITTGSGVVGVRR